MSPDEAQKEIHEIMHSDSHPMHERFTKSHPDAIEHMNKLWEATAVSPPAEPVPPGAPVPAPQASPNRPPLNLGPTESDIANERRLAETHLIETLGAREAGEAVRNAREVFGQLFQRDNASDQAMLARIEMSIGNDVEVITHLAGLRGKLAGLGPSLDVATVARMSQDEKLSRAVAATVALLGSLDSPLVRRLEKFFPDGQSQLELMNWLASKNFR
jgi:hypothetical protein